MKSKILKSLSLTIFALVCGIGRLALAEMRIQGSQQGIGYTSGEACQTLREVMAEDFVAKNKSLFGLKENLRLIEIKETQSGPGSLAVDSTLLATYEQRSGAVVENVQIYFRGRKNFECDDFKANSVSVEVVDFRLQ